MKAGLFCLAMCAFATPAAQAQMTWTDKGFLNVTGGIQAGSHTLATELTFDLYDELATVRTTQDISGGAFFDLSAGYKVWRNLALGAGYSWTSSKADAAVSASIPSTDVHDQPRAITASAADLNHTEHGIHFMAVWMVPITDKIDVGVSAGPTIFQVKQDLPGALTISEPGPSVTGAAVSEVNKTTIGVNVGVDVTYLVTKRIGVGGLARYTKGSAELDGVAKKLTVGGFQIGGGVRIRF